MSRVDSGGAADKPESSPQSPAVDQKPSWAVPAPDSSTTVEGTEGTPEGLDRQQVISERAELHFDQRNNSRNIDGGFEQTCPEAAATQVAQDMGVNVSFDEVIDHAVAEGICADDGSVESMNDVRQLLEDHGVPANAFPDGCDLDGIAGDARSGRGVIAAVDSSVLYGQPSTQTGPDHVVDVIWVDVDESNNPTVVHLNDSGLEDDQGRDIQIPADVFRQAFEGERGGAAAITDYQRPRTTP